MTVLLRLFKVVLMGTLSLLIQSCISTNVCSNIVKKQLWFSVSVLFALYGLAAFKEHQH